MRVDFYIVETPGMDAAEHTICRLVEKAYRGGHTIFINTGGEVQKERLDRLLWTFRESSFVPHECLPAVADTTVAVMIAAGEAPPKPRDVLINVADDVPPFYDRFGRIAEIVPNESSAKAAGRTRFRLYRDQDIEIRSHQLS